MNGEHSNAREAPTTETVTHTPGPWWVERRVGDALQVNAKHRGEGSSYCVASVNHWEGETDRANARLIAAAPEMLAALKELLSAELTPMPVYEAGKEAQNAWADRRAKARNDATYVIAKAEEPMPKQRVRGYLGSTPDGGINDGP